MEIAAACRLLLVILVAIPRVLGAMMLDVVQKGKNP